MGDLVWDDRLISRGEAWAYAAQWPVRPGHRRGLEFVDCGRCGQAVLPLGTTRAPFATCPEQISQAVLRHMVSGHGVALNARRGDGGRAGADPGLPGDGQADAAGGRVPGRPRAGAAGRRLPDSPAGSRRVAGTAGDDRP